MKAVLGVLLTLAPLYATPLELPPPPASDAAHVKKEAEELKNMPAPQFEVISYGMGCDVALSADEWVLLTSKLEILYSLKVFPPAVMDASGIFQKLDVFNDKGKRLGEFPLVLSTVGRVINKPDAQIIYDRQMTKAIEPGGAAYLRLKGELKLPLSLLTRGDVIEIMPRQGEEMLLTPPGTEPPAEDIAVSGEGMDRLFISGAEPRFVKKDVILIQMQYFNQNSGLDVEKIELLDEKGRVMDIRVDKLTGTPPRFSFPYPAELKDKPMRLRPVYKKFRQYYYLPVDVKLDMRGTSIRSGAEK